MTAEAKVFVPCGVCGTLAFEHGCYPDPNHPGHWFCGHPDAERLSREQPRFRADQADLYDVTDDEVVDWILDPPEPVAIPEATPVALEPEKPKIEPHEPKYTEGRGTVKTHEYVVQWWTGWYWTDWNATEDFDMTDEADAVRAVEKAREIWPGERSRLIQIKRSESVIITQAGRPQ